MFTKIPPSRHPKQIYSSEPKLKERIEKELGSRIFYLAGYGSGDRGNSTEIILLVKQWKAANNNNANGLEIDRQPILHYVADCIDENTNLIRELVCLGIDIDNDLIKIIKQNTEKYNESFLTEILNLTDSDYIRKCTFDDVIVIHGTDTGIISNYFLKLPHKP